MTIKKTMKVTSVKKPGAAASGGAAISDRFKLDAPPPQKATASGPAMKAAAIAGLLGLAVAGTLTFVLWKHWEFLMPA